MLNEQSIVRDAKLIVLDEVSMVGEEMARDLLAFGKPILVLGDPGQLPPIKGEGAFTSDAPDVMLTEIHRQAGESAIIRLATLARQGQPIAYGEHDPYVWKMPRDVDRRPSSCSGRPGDLRPQRHPGAAQPRHEAGRRVPRSLSHGRGAPEHAEKIICLKNRADLGIVNGMFLHLDGHRGRERALLLRPYPARGRARRCDRHRRRAVPDLQGPLRRPRHARSRTGTA